MIFRPDIFPMQKAYIKNIYKSLKYYFTINKSTPPTASPSHQLSHQTHLKHPQ